MNGSTSTRTVFDDIRLSLNPATLDAALGKRKLQAIDIDGGIIYDEGRSTNDQLTERLERIWNEYPNGLLDISEERLERLPQDEDAIRKQDKETQEQKEKDPFQMMNRSDMEQLRSEVHDQLNSARNELWYVLELAKTLAASSSYTNQPPPAPNQQPETTSKKGKAKAAQKANEADTKTALAAAAASVPQEPPILPPGTFSLTPSSRPTKPTHAQVHELELVLAAKQQALDECSTLIDSAVSELQMMANAGDRFWKDVRKLKEGNNNGRGQWAVLPKPDFGRTTIDGEKAKDIIVPYAVDEAPLATRTRCLAAFDLDPTKEDALTFGSRSFLRLKTTLKDVSGAVVESSPVDSPPASDVRAQMDAAQMEAFDEDLFGEIRYEGSQMSKSELEPRSVSLPIAGYTLGFELYDIRSSSQTPTSPLCDLIISSARLNLINLYRQRKTKLVSPTFSDTNSASILKHIVDALRYKQLCNTVDSAMKNFYHLFQTAGLDVVFDSRMITDSDESSETITNFLTGRSGADSLSGSYELDIPGCHGLKIDVFAPFRTSVTLKNATFDLSDPDELSHILSEEFATQLIDMIFSQLRIRLSDAPASVRSQVFLDELESVIHLADLGQLRLSIPPPFHTILCNVDPSPDAKLPLTDVVEGYDARRDGHVQGWIHRIVEKIIAPH
ncbi:uncharacterized protein L201_005083 [Kwoniella dendrophila CBS 6074]|uniref:Mediator of RNA polymerase II transcription subunit 17 n=1 Tax=Kwoniella dendrophila CBS 6074 TaxID=1295534 RepID=A0AAX4K031_9TREE